MMRKLFVIIITIVIATVFCNEDIYSQNYRVIKVSEVSKVVLKMFDKLGRFEGYLIFYSKEGEQCAVKPLPKPTRRYQVPWIEGIAANKVFIEKKLEITPDKFKILQLRDGSVIFAYPIKLYVRGKFSGGHKVIFRFEWLKLKAEDVCYLNSSE